MFSSLIIEKGLSVASRIGKWEINTYKKLLKSVKICIQYSILAQVLLLLTLFIKTNFFSLTLFALAILLCIMQCTQYFISDLLFTKNKHIISARLELMSAFLQLVFFILLTFTELSVAASIFLSGIAASMVNSSLLIRSLIKAKVLTHSSEVEEISLRNIGRYIFWSITQYLHANQEKAMVLFFLDFTNFAKYTICTSYFVVLKSVSDIGNKFFMKEKYHKAGEKVRISVLVITPITFGVIFLVPSLFLIKEFLGDYWLVTWEIIMFSCVIECIRYLVYGDSVRALHQSKNSLMILAQLLWMIFAFVFAFCIYYISSWDGILPVLLIMFILNLILIRNFKKVSIEG